MCCCVRLHLQVLVLARQEGAGAIAEEWATAAQVSGWGGAAICRVCVEGVCI